MAKTNNESIIRLCIVFFASLVLTHFASANQQSQKSNGQNTRALEMQIQQLKARENVKHKMLQDQIAAVENRLKILEEKVKENQKEIKFLKRLSR
jgi:uncharacterized protein YlxW (UPF0749 family)